jgi:hypothetical protein
VAFVDDLTIAAFSLAELQGAADLISQFNSLCGLKSNPSKCVVIHAGKRVRPSERELQIGGKAIRRIQGREPIRLLGSKGRNAVGLLSSVQYPFSPATRWQIVLLYMDLRGYPETSVSIKASLFGFCFVGN